MLRRRGYVIDASHSHVQFAVERFGFNAIIGDFRDISGVISIDADHPENSKVSATIGVASVVSGDDERDGHVRGPHWLNAAAFSTMIFTSTSVDQLSDTEADVTGDLTLLGVTKPVTLNVRLNKLGNDIVSKRPAAGFSATGVVKRSDFGLTTAAGLIGDDISIRIETLAIQPE